MQACHWKAHNTFTNFYLKDLTWSDNENNMYLGPVVAAQQVLDPSPQYTHLWEEKKGGGTPAAASSDVYGKVSYVFNCIMYLVFISVPLNFGFWLLTDPTFRTGALYL